LRKRLRSCYNSQNDSSNSGVLFRGGFVAAKGAKEVSPMSRIVVVGSVNMDLVMQAPRLPVLGETLAAGPFVTASGGKGANQAVAAARLGASVGMVGRVGDDAFGGTLRLALEQEGIHVEHLLVSSGSSTGVASIFVVEGDNAIAIAPGANALLSPSDVRNAAPLFSDASCALFQLEVPPETVLEGLRLAREKGVRTILNPAPWTTLSEEVLTLTDLFVPNRIELAQFSGTEDLLEGALAALDRGVGAVVVTAGKDGAFLFERVGYGERPAHLAIAPPRITAVDSTGAGDAFVAALAVTLAEGGSLAEAVRFGTGAGACACLRLGAQPSLPRREEVERLLVDAASETAWTSAGK
jgi:ribokinase